MCVIGKNQLVSLIKAHKCVHPFDYGLLDGDGYVLTVREERTLHYLEHQNLVSNEVVFTPPEFVAHLTAKSKYGRMGLSFLNAANVHSGASIPLTRSQFLVEISSRIRLSFGSLIAVLENS